MKDIIENILNVIGKVLSLLLYTMSKGLEHFFGAMSNFFQRKIKGQ